MCGNQEANLLRGFTGAILGRFSNTATVDEVENLFRVIANPEPTVTRSRNASAVSDAPHMEWQVDFWGRAGRVRYSCLKEAAGEEASMQIQWCLS